MGCKACDLAQATGENLYFIRVGAANVMILACPKHMDELRRLYLAGLHAEQGSNTTAQINEERLARTLSAHSLIVRPFTYQGTARLLLADLAEYGFVLMHRDDL